jgi:hypothetical protein
MKLQPLGPSISEVCRIAEIATELHFDMSIRETQVPVGRYLPEDLFIRTGIGGEAVHDDGLGCAGGFVRLPVNAPACPAQAVNVCVPLGSLSSRNHRQSSGAPRSSTRRQWRHCPQQFPASHDKRFEKLVFLFLTGCGGDCTVTGRRLLEGMPHSRRFAAKVPSFMHIHL